MVESNEGTSLADALKRNLTVREALVERGGELKELIAWARGRLDKAAATIDLAVNPDWPDGSSLPDLHVASDALFLAETVAEDVTQALAQYAATQGRPDLLALVGQAFNRLMDSAGAEMEAWEMTEVEALPVAELMAMLDAAEAAEAPGAVPGKDPR